MVKELDIEDNLIILDDFNYHAYLLREKPLSDEIVNKEPFFNEVMSELDLKEAFGVRGKTNDEIHENVTFKERNNRYDFIFYSDDFENIGANIDFTMEVSDHLPLSLYLRLKE